LKPDFTFLHVVPEKYIKKNISGAKNKYDKFNKNFYNKVQKGFLKILKKDRNKIIIDSSKTKKYNIDIIKGKINKILKIND
jgi:Thymidylate kinase